MPLLRGAVTFSRFTVEPHAGASRDWPKEIPAALRGKAFEPLDLKGVDERAAGFVELENHDASDFAKGELFHGEHALFTWRLDGVKIHPAQIKAELARWVKTFEAEQGRPPGRREKQEAKAQIRHDLRHRSPVVTTTADVAWSLDTDELQVWAASRRLVDEVQDALEQALQVRLVPIVPAIVADRNGLPERALAPTPALTVPASERGAAPASPAVDEERDPVEAEQGKAREEFLRGKAYLGREFLTWLLWRSESGEPLLSREDLPVTVLFTDRLALKGITGEIVDEVMRGALAPYSPHVRDALGRGLLVHAAKLRLMHGERASLVTLDAEAFTFKGCKLPELMTEEADDQLQERLFLVGEITGMVDALLEQFLKLRASRVWADDVADMREWMREGAREAA